MTRSLIAAALLIGISACEPSIPKTAPTSVVTAVFDPTTSSIPLPNDLAFLVDPNSTCPAPANALPAGSPPACAQAELLTSFAGAFPSDQEVAITIEFTETTFGSDDTQTQIAPDLDLTTFTPTTYYVVGTTAAGTGIVATEPLTAADYVKGATSGTLTIHNVGHAPWPSGSYSVVVRGGPNGVKTTDGLPVYASQIFSLIEQGLDLTNPSNNGLLKAQLGSETAAVAQGMQLNLLIALYQSSAFPAADMQFPHQELAIATTFKIQQTVTNVEIDPARSLVPLPIDLLRDATTGKLTPLAACTLAGSSLAADGTCPSAAAAGFLALDGFSTTGALLAPTSDLINANTVTGATLQLYDLTDPENPVVVDPTTLIEEPCEFTSGCGSASPLSPVIALQPAGASAGSASSVLTTKPLKDNTDYAVVMTTGILDKAGNPIGPGTVAKILRFTNPIVVGGHSALAAEGIDDATAAQLDKMRLQLKPVFTKLAAGGTTSADIAMAYTFHTQTILSQAVQLAALPYLQAADTALPITASFVNETPAVAFAKYGVDTTTANKVPLNHIDEILEVDITTFNAIDPATGAFLADPTMAVPETIHVLIATPIAGAAVPACTGSLAAFSPARCSPLMVFRHGLGGGRADMLTVADSFAAAGMTVVAIDAALHGDRAFCTSGTTGAASGCIGGGACTTTLPAGAQGDVNPPGTCAAGFVTAPVSATCTGACATAATDGIPVVSGNYLISANFFRTRDSQRQDLIDQSQLIRALAFVPTGAPPTGHAVFDHMITRGVIIDPGTIFYSGQSLGSIQGAMDVATNPRISKAAFNVGGGTIVDVFTNSPAFVAGTDALLAGLGIMPGTSAYLQFLVVAKTVLDPADPLNYVGHIQANTLPNLLPPLGGATDGSVPQAAKAVLTQMAFCDQTVPNPFNLLFASGVGTSPLPPNAFAPGAKGTFQLFVNGIGSFNPTTFGGSCSPLPAAAVEHAFLTDWVHPAITLQAQTDLAAFVMSNTLPLSVQN